MSRENYLLFCTPETPNQFQSAPGSMSRENSAQTTHDNEPLCFNPLPAR